MSNSAKEAISKALRSYVGLDESIHSFLLRTQLCHDQNAKPRGVIAPNGNWVNVPYANKELCYLFHRFCDHQLMEAIDISRSIDGSENTLFDSP